MDHAVTQLIERGKDRFDFTVYATTLAPDLRSFVKWVRIPSPQRPIPLKFVSFFVLAGLRLNRASFDLVCTIGAVVPNRTDVAWVHYCHAGFYRAAGRLAPGEVTIARRLNTALLRLLSLVAEHWCYRERRTGTLVAVSRGVAEELARDFHGIPVEVVPNGVDLDRFEPRQDRRVSFRSQLDAEDDCVALFVGGDWARKGLEIAIEGLARARAAGAHRLRLWVVGKGDGRRYAAFADSLGVGDAVEFFGPRADTERFYCAADMFVLPTDYEAFPLVVLEALASGLPIIAPPVNGVVDIFKKCQPGILVERMPEAVGEALLKLGSDPQLRRGMSATARALAAVYSWERSSEAMLDIFEAAVATNSQHPREELRQAGMSQ